MQDSLLTPEEKNFIPRVQSVQVDRELCQSAATCLAWNIYELDDESKAVLLTSNGLNSDDIQNTLASPDGTVLVSDLVNEDNQSLTSMQEAVLESAKSCPFNAIIVRDDQGNQIWPVL
jgi:ferredoxin